MASQFDFLPSYFSGYTAKNSAYEATWEFRTGISDCKDHPDNNSYWQNILYAATLRNWKEAWLAGSISQDIIPKHHLLHRELKARIPLFSLICQHPDWQPSLYFLLKTCMQRTWEYVVFPYWFVKAWGIKTCTNHTNDRFSCCKRWF